MLHLQLLNGFPLRWSIDRTLLTPSCTLELALSVEYKNAIATTFFVTVVVAALTMFLITTPVLCLLEVVSELEDLCWKDLDFFFKGKKAAFLVDHIFLMKSWFKILEFQEMEMRGREVSLGVPKICNHKFQV